MTSIICRGFVLNGLCKAMKTVPRRTISTEKDSCTKERKLFTPGPLSVSRTTKEAMLRDLGSREPEFIDLVRNIRHKTLEMAGVSQNAYTCVPLQGSGSFALEAVLSTTVPKNGGRVLILENGAYGRRQASMCQRMDIDYHMESFGETSAVDVERVVEILTTNSDSFSHVSVVHSETSTGILNDVRKIGEEVHKYAPKASFFVDAMSSFGAVPLNMEESHIDYMVSSANKCIQGVPGFSFAICRLEPFLKCKGFARSVSLDLLAQYEGLTKDGQFRFTPPTHSMLAFGQALKELDEEGGVLARNTRYQNNKTCLTEGMEEFGFKTLLPSAVAGPIITTYLYPTHPNFDFDEFYKRIYEKGHVIYPGKLSNTDFFRLGNIGDLHEKDMKALLIAIEETCKEMGISLPLS